METTLSAYTEVLLKLNEKFEGAIEKTAFHISLERYYNPATGELKPSIKILHDHNVGIIKMIANKFAPDDYMQEFTDSGFIKIRTYIDDVHIDLTLT